MFQAGHSLCSKQYIACVPIIISSCHHSIISSCHHIIISANQKSASQFWAKSQEKNRNRLVYPSTKNHRELNFGMSGVVFRDRSAGDAQKCTAPPNRHFTCFVMTFEILRKFHPKKFFRHRKVKCRESSETRFGKVSRRSEPCLSGKRPFEVFDFFFEFCEIRSFSKNRSFIPVLADADVSAGSGSVNWT